MSRALVVLASLAAAVWLCLVPSSSPSGRAEAADEALTAEVKANLDASLIVFAGEVTGLGPAPGKGDDAVQWVSYRVAGVMKGSCSEASLVVEHVLRDHPNPAGPGLDPTLFAAGSRLIVGVQLHRGREASDYSLRNAGAQFGPVVVTETMLRDVVQYVNPALFARMSERQQRAVCMNNLSQLTQVYLIQSMENRAKAQKYSGVALWLAYRKNASEIKRGDERVLLCPADKEALLPKTEAEQKLFDEADLENPRPGLCSYAGRDFARCPLPDGEKPEPIGACLHHVGGAVVAFDDGSAQFLTLKELGLDSEADKIVGPDLKSPLLRVLR